MKGLIWCCTKLLYYSDISFSCSFLLGLFSMISFALVARHNIVFESDTVMEVLEGDEDDIELLSSCDTVDVESCDDMPGYKGHCWCNRE